MKDHSSASLALWRPPTFGNLSGSPNQPEPHRRRERFGGPWRAGRREQTVNLLPGPVAPKMPALAAENRSVRTAVARNIKGFTLKHYFAKVGVEDPESLSPSRFSLAIRGLSLAVDQNCHATITGGGWGSDKSGTLSKIRPTACADRADWSSGMLSAPCCRSCGPAHVQRP